MGNGMRPSTACLSLRRPVLLVINKIDRVPKQDLLP